MKYLFCLALIIHSFSNSLCAQASENTPGNGPTGTRVFKVYNNPIQEKTDQVEVTGFGGTTFTASNTADGTTNSFNHSVQVSLTLTTSKGGNSVQLYFYNSSNNVQQAASSTDGTLNIYYPIQLYDAIKSKLDQAFAAKKKVVVKIVQKPNGYREGSLVL